MPDLRVGLVGAGWVATDRYLPVLRRLDQVEVVGIADRNRDRARAAAVVYDSTPYGDVADLIGLRPDVIFVCTSPFSHAATAIAAMRSGIHAFVEKPMAMDDGEASEMIDAMRDTGMKLGVSHNMLFARSVRRARGRIASGKLGDIRHVLAVQASSPDRRLPHWYPELRGGLFFDEAPHMLYLIDSILGGFSIDHVWSEGSGGLTSLGADLVGDSGVRGELTMIFDSPVSEWFITVICERGIVVVDLFRDIQFLIPPDGGHRPFQILRTSASGVIGHGLGTISTGTRYLAMRQFWGHEVVISDFLDAVRTDREPTVSAEDGARVVTRMVEILDAAGVD